MRRNELITARTRFLITDRLFRQPAKLWKGRRGGFALSIWLSDQPDFQKRRIHYTARTEDGTIDTHGIAGTVFEAALAINAIYDTSKLRGE